MPAADEPVVVNAGPLLWLGYCGQIDLLRALHARVLTPLAVMDELRRQRHWPPAGHASAPTWVEVEAPSAPPSSDLRTGLDDGEAHVIALAIERGIRLVAIDETKGRAVALARGLVVTGSVGVLVRAKKQGLLAAVKPCLDAMRAGGAWLGEELLAAILRDAGEA